MSEQKETLQPGQFQGDDGNTYEIVLPAIRIKGSIVTHEELLSEAHSAARAALLAHAWKGRDEENFHRNGIFRQVF